MRNVLGRITALPALEALLSPPPASNVIPLKSPGAFRIVRRAIHQRAFAVDATDQQRRNASRAGIRELDAGHSTACAIAVAMRELPSVRQTRLQPA